MQYFPVVAFFSRDFAQIEPRSESGGASHLAKHPEMASESRFRAILLFYKAPRYTLSPILEDPRALTCCTQNIETRTRPALCSFLCPEQSTATTILIPNNGSLNLKNQYNYSHFGGIDPLGRARASSGVGNPPHFHPRVVSGTLGTQ